MNISFNSQRADSEGNVGGLFGVLNNTATIENVTINGDLNAGTGNVSGLIAYVDTANVTMKNI